MHRTVRLTEASSCVWCERDFPKRYWVNLRKDGKHFCQDPGPCNKRFFEIQSVIPLEAENDDDEEAEGMEVD